MTNSFVNNFNDGAASANEYTQLHNEYICRAAFVQISVIVTGSQVCNQNFSLTLT